MEATTVVKAKMDLYRMTSGRVMVTDSETARMMGMREATDAEVRRWYLTEQFPYQTRMTATAEARIEAMKAEAGEGRVDSIPDPEAKKPGGGCGCGGKKKAAAEERERTDAKSWLRMAKGAVGLAKTAVGVDQAGEETVAARWAVCEGCDSNSAGVCGECGCHLSAKVRLTRESCPIERW